MKKIMMLFAVLLTVGCTKPEKAQQLLEAQGYTDVKLTGYDWFACSKEDYFHTGFTAKTPTGRNVAGTVCSGLFFRGATIRFDLTPTQPAATLGS